MRGKDIRSHSNSVDIWPSLRCMSTGLRLEEVYFGREVAEMVPSARHGAQAAAQVPVLALNIDRQVILHIKLRDSQSCAGPQSTEGELSDGR